jgi:ribosomal protein L29
MRTFHIIFFICVLLYLNNNYADGRRRKSKANQESVDEITYKSPEELNDKLNNFKKNLQNDKHVDGEIQIDKLKEEEVELKKKLYRAILNHGETSREKATALHALGMN